MKKLLSIATVLLCTSTVFSQGQNWKLNGNIISQGDYLGTNNNEPMIFKANGNEGLRIKPNGDLRIKNFDDNTYTGLMFINSNGVLSKLNFTGNSSDVLLGNGTFGSIGALSGWTLSGNIIFSNYNVGIGTNIAPEALSVNGNILANGSISGTSLNVVDIVGAGKEFKISTSLCMKGIDVNDPNSRNELCGMNGDLFIQSEHNNSYNTVFGFGNGSKTGFGVIPTEKFHVGTDAKFDGGLILNGLSSNSIGDILMIDANGKVSRGAFEAIAASGYTLDCRTDANGNILPSWHTGPFKLTTGGTVCEYGIKVGINTDNPLNFLDVRGDGNIIGKWGINTNTPLNDLDVRGNASIEEHLGVGVTTLNTNYKLHVKTIAETGIKLESNFTYDNLSAFSITIDRDLTKAISVVDSRNGQENFKVNGNGFVYARRFWVTLDPFPDYVFANDYNLMSLNELENYITINKHLPNVPTAEEVSQNGLELGEMNRVLVEKVEELTLYLIEQNKKIEELQKEVENMKNK